MATGKGASPDRGTEMMRYYSLYLLPPSDLILVPPICQSQPDARRKKEAEPPRAQSMLESREDGSERQKSVLILC